MPEDVKKLLLFDFDGTLVDSGEAAVLATQKAFEDFSLDVPDRAAILALTGIPIEKSFAMLADGVDIVAISEELFKVFRAHHHVLSDQYMQTAHSGINPMLDALSADPLNIMGVFSSKKSSVVELNMTQAKISAAFNFIVGSDNVTHYKPHPHTVFELLAKYEISDVRKAAIIGDSIFDIRMGVSAGIHAVGVAWGYHTAEDMKKEGAHFIAPDPATLAEYLKAL